VHRGNNPISHQFLVFDRSAYSWSPNLLYLPEIPVALWWLCEPPGLAGLVALLFFDRDSGQWVRPGFALIDEQIDQGVGAHEVRDDTAGRALAVDVACVDADHLGHADALGKAKTGAPDIPPQLKWHSTALCSIASPNVAGQRGSLATMPPTMIGLSSLVAERPPPSAALVPG
jgi:hypothetical protein